MNATVNNNDLNIKYQDLDSSELFVLQGAYKSMQNFLDLTCGAIKSNSKDALALEQQSNSGQAKIHDPIIAVLNPNKDPQVASKRANMPLKSLFVPGNNDNHNEPDGNGTSSNAVISCVANDLVMSQDQLKRLSVRLEILETLQVNLQRCCKLLKNIKLCSCIEKYGLGPFSKL